MTMDKGKWAEKEVEKVLKHLNEKYAGFAYERLADARSARGAFKAQISDFIFWWASGIHKVSGAVEVKETKHDFRLVKDKVAQLPRINRVVRAGGEGLIVVFHSEIQKWRIIDSSTLELNVPSWDLSDLPVFGTAKEAMASKPLVLPA